MYFGMRTPQPGLDEKGPDFETRVIDWMQLMQGTVLSTQPELGYVAEIIGKSRDEIEKAKEQLSTEQIVKVVERVEVALSHAESQVEHKRCLQVEQLANRSKIISRLEDDEINLARARIENRMFRAPIILIPFCTSDCRVRIGRIRGNRY